MVNYKIEFIERTTSFLDDIKHIKDKATLEKIEKQVKKIMLNPEVGKPLRHNMKGERTIYIKPYRLVYRLEGKVLFLHRYEHRDKIY